jgi:arylsulfatase A-like enzyme
MRVLMLEIDGLQPAYLGPYGCEWAPTPTWDNLAVVGVVFDQHFADCPDPAAGPGWRTGRHPLIDGPAGPDLLADLRSAGIRTARVAPLTSDDGWDINVAAKRGQTNPLALNSTRKMVRQAIEQLGDAPDALLRVEIDALLPPWRPSEEARADCFGESTEGDAEPWTDDVPEQIDLNDERTFGRLQNTYAAAVSTLDVGLRKVLADCAKRGFGDDALWIVTSSRGFPLGEHGAVGLSSADVHEELVHLPLLLRWPQGENGGMRVSSFTQPADLAPTIRKTFGLPIAATNDTRAGQSLGGLARGNDAPTRDRIVSGIRRGERTYWGYRTSSWYLMSDDRPDSPRRLFVKPDDRWEVNDIAPRNQEFAEEMEKEFSTWLPFPKIPTNLTPAASRTGGRRANAGANAAPSAPPTHGN